MVWRKRWDTSGNFSLFTHAIIMIDRLTTTVTVRAIQGAMNIDLERIALVWYHAINGDIREVQKRLEGLFIKHHYQPRSNRISVKQESQVIVLYDIATPCDPGEPKNDVGPSLQQNSKARPAHLP